MNADTKQALIECISAINEARFEISRLNAAHRETIFNPAATSALDYAKRLAEDALSPMAGSHS